MERVAVVGPGIVLEAVEGPDDHRSEVHEHRQNVHKCQNLIERRRKQSQQSANSEKDDEDGKDEADAVDGYAPLEAGILVELTGVQADEDNAGNKSLEHLQESRDSGEEPTNLPRSGSGQSHLDGVQEEGQAGAHTGANLSGAVGAGEVDWIDDGSCKDH